MGRKRYWTTLEVESGGRTQEYAVSYTVTPGEAETPRTMGSPGEPGCAAGVDDISVFWEHEVRCGAHRYGENKDLSCGVGRCHTQRDPRPELESLVDADALELGGDEGPDPDEAYERARDDG